MSKMGTYLLDIELGYEEMPESWKAQRKEKYGIAIVRPTLDCNGTALQGSIESSLDELVSAFGECAWTSTDPESKVSHCWEITFEHVDKGIVRATIYDWKQHDGGARVNSNATMSYNVGGDSQCAVDCVLEWLSKTRGKTNERTSWN